MLILGIDTSCDETAAAVVADGCRILSNVLSTQEIHAEYGGVVPELASREHMRSIVGIVGHALDKAAVSMSDLDVLAVTEGPGLIGGLLVGLSFVKGVSSATGKPFRAVNHLEGHIFAHLLDGVEADFPFLTLVVSGGHTELVLVRDFGEFAILGRTLDDAAGEALDKMAKLLDLGYPGGPVVDRIASGGDPAAIRFPRALRNRPGLDFSFSGLKTAGLLRLEADPEYGSGKNRADFLASYLEAVIDPLIRQTGRAAKEQGVNRIVLAGGVAANSRLRKRAAVELGNCGYEVVLPSVELCTDNGAMIAAAAWDYVRRGEYSDLSVTPNPALSL